MFLILKPEESGLFQNSHELMGWRITIRSSRDRFAARLHGDVYHSAVPRSGPA